MAVLTAHSHENKIPVRQSSIFQEANKNVPRTLSRWSLRTASMVPCECDSVKRVCVCVHLAECREFASGQMAQSFVKNRPLSRETAQLYTLRHKQI